MRRSLTSAIRPYLLAASALYGLTTAPAHAQDRAGPGPANAAADSESDRGGDSIIVTGSRLSRSTFDSPSPVTMLNGDDLARRGVTNIAEAITELPSFRDSTGPRHKALAASMSARASSICVASASREIWCS